MAWINTNVRVRTKCDCGRYQATADDWTDDNIKEGERDDLCWGPGANHEAPWPPDTNEDDN